MATTPLKFQVSSTVSPEAAQALAAFYAKESERPKLSPPATQEDFDKLSAAASEAKRPQSDAFAAKVGLLVQHATLGGVPALRITPKGFTAASGNPVLLYIHGGGYVVFSAAVELVLPGLLADALGMEVVSVDYTLAPRADYRAVTDQLVSVFRALLAEGRTAAQVAVFGDSAGGGMTLATTLKLRDQGSDLPAALLLISPSTDISEAGDTRMSLGASDADPILSRDSFALLGKAYAQDGVLDHPYASPVHGDYAKPFPPTMIQGGTRELLLSDFVRLYRALVRGEKEAVLDLYEGMPHVFQARFPDIPETREAVARASEFLRQHLPAA